MREKHNIVVVLEKDRRFSDLGIEERHRLGHFWQKGRISFPEERLWSVRIEGSGEEEGRRLWPLNETHHFVLAAAGPARKS